MGALSVVAINCQGFANVASLAIMLLTIQDLKVDQTYLRFENSGILVTNINIPESEFEQLDTVLNRAQHLITTDYVNIPNVQFQVCATYELRNTKTGDVRQWTGSFNPRGNQSSTLTDFQTYLPHNFKDIVIESASPDNVFRKLRFYLVATNWVFQRLTSIIVSVQCVMPETHPTILRRSLLACHNARRSRSICTFLLP